MTDDQAALVVVQLIVLIAWLAFRVFCVIWARGMARRRFRRPWVWGWWAAFFGWLPLLVLLCWGTCKRRRPVMMEAT
jgi:hypothetical protein